MTSLRPHNVLFLCTGNSARSIMAEAFLSATAKGRFRALSAGSHPNGSVHPMALQVLEQFHIPTDELRSKSWDEYAVPGATALDFVFTVCDKAAGEVCPMWPGQPVTAHWGVPDPAAVTNEAAQRKAFLQAFTDLSRRIALFTSLPIEQLDRITLRNRVEEIGRR